MIDFFHKLIKMREITNSGGTVRAIYNSTVSMESPDSILFFVRYTLIYRGMGNRAVRSGLRIGTDCLT